MALMLQARVVVYKDAARIAGGYAATNAKALAPSMAGHMTQVS